MTQILIVDDEAEIRDFLGRHLRYLGYDVEFATNGQEGLDKLAEKRMDIVISDIGMPVMTGVEMLTRIRQDFPMVRVIMITGYVSQANVLACMRKGAEMLIFKPLEDLDELEAAVQRAADGIERWWVKLGELSQMKSSPPAV